MRSQTWWNITVVFLGSCAVFIAALCCVWLHQRNLQLGYQLAQAQKQHAALVEHMEKLKIQTAALHAPGQLKIWAAALNLAPPAATAVIDLKVVGTGQTHARQP